MYTKWRIRLNDGVEFVCQWCWCPTLNDAEQIWPYTPSIPGADGKLWPVVSPLAMRECLGRPEVSNGHSARTRLRECPTCVTAVLEGQTDCGPVFVKEDRDALHQVLAAEETP